MPTLQGDGATLEEMQRMSEAANEWMAFESATFTPSSWARSIPSLHGSHREEEGMQDKDAIPFHLALSLRYIY
jgi:hypothetical protein